MKAPLIVAAICAWAGVARADDAPVVHAAARTTVSVPLLGLPLHGATVEVERDLPAYRLSVVGALTVRSTAGGDYDSTTLGAGGEVRYWLRRRALWTKLPRGSAIGWYVAGRLDLTRTTLRDAAGDDLGAVDTVGVSALAGYRFAPWRGLELRPYAGFALRHDHGGGPSWSRPSLAYGLAAGWRF